MSIIIIRLLIACSLTMSLVSCSESNELTPESELFPHKLKERIGLKRYESTVDTREVEYWSNSDKIHFETIYLRNGDRVDVTYRENETVSNIIEYYAQENEGDLLYIRRHTVVDETGLTPISDVIYRKDETIELAGKAIQSEDLPTYEVLKYFSDGKSLRHKRVLKKFENEWLTSQDEVYLKTGEVNIRTQRLEDTTYKREYLNKAGTVLRVQIWNPERTIVKTTFYEDDGKTVTHIVTETAAQRNILFYNASGFIKQMKDVNGISESLTMYDDNGHALYSQAWRHEPKSSNGSKAGNLSLNMVDVLRTSDSISKKYYFFPTTHTLQFVIEQSETEKDGWRKRTRIYDENGWLVSDQTINELNKVVENKAVKTKSIRYPNIDSLYLMYRPLKDPPSQLSDKWWKD